MSLNPVARVDAVIRDAASQQRGVVARRQLLEAGVSPRAIQYRIETARLTPVYRGVYAVSPVNGPRRREMAALLACGDASFLGSWSAAAVWEMIPYPATRPVAIITRHDNRRRNPGIRIFRSPDLPDAEVTTQERLPVTTPARTLLDLAATGAAKEVERALHRAVPGLVQPEEIQDLLHRYPRRRGRPVLHELLESLAGLGMTRSEAEREFLRVVRSGGLPLPETNAILLGHEVDCVWRDERLVVEVDGRAYHSDPDAFESDRIRDARLLAAGFRVMRVTWKQIQQRPRPLLVRLARALESRDR